VIAAIFVFLVLSGGAGWGSRGFSPARPYGATPTPRFRSSALVGVIFGLISSRIATRE
jgi:hypothetical protein